jgi:ABC-type phosphate transport system substrate-binding protein
MRRALALAGAGIVVLALASPAVASTPADQLVGGGESWPEYTVRRLQNDAARAGALGSLDPVYIAGRGESGGRADLAAGDADFAVSEAPFNADELAVAAQHGVRPAYVPYAYGAVAVAAAVQADRQHGGQLITGIKLTMPTLAKIFAHSINYWNDPEILAENPDVPVLAHVEVPAILTVVRRDSSSTTAALVAAFLADPAARVTWNTYAQGLGQAPDTTPDHWPTDPNGNVTGVTSGTRGAINALLNLDPTTGRPILGSPAHSIGYVAPAFADDFGAPLVAVQNRAAAPTFEYPLPDTELAAVSGSAFDPATNLFAIDYAKITADRAYPIPLVSYLVVPLPGVGAGKAPALAGFIRFVLGRAGQDDVSATGMVPVAPEIAAAGLKVADALVAPAAVTNTTTTSATAAPTTTTTTAAGTVQASSVAPRVLGSSSTLPVTGGGPDLGLAALGAALAAMAGAGRRRLRRTAR